MTLLVLDMDMLQLCIRTRNALYIQYLGTVLLVARPTYAPYRSPVDRYILYSHGRNGGGCCYFVVMAIRAFWQEELATSRILEIGAVLASQETGATEEIYKHTPKVHVHKQSYVLG